MADLEFFWDPVCPWAWITSRWVVNVLEEKPMDVDWRFISLRMVNHDKDYERDFRPGYDRAPKGTEAVELWDAVIALGSNSHFSELKRSTRGRPQFEG